MDGNEPVFILCWRVSEDVPRQVHLPGSTKQPCSECGELVWASPSTLVLQETEDAKLVCNQCHKVIDPEGKVPFQDFTPAQRAEIETVIRLVRMRRFN